MSTFPFIPELDGRVVLYGEYENGITTFTLPAAGMAINCMVLSSDFGTDAGLIYNVNGVFGDRVEVNDDFSGGAVMLGRLFEASVDLTRPFARDQQGLPKESGRTRVQNIRVSHHKSNAFAIRMEHFAPPTRDDRTKVFFGVSPFDPDAEAAAANVKRFLTAWMQGRADRCRVSIENDTPWPSTIVGVEWYIDYERTEGGA